MLDTVVISGEYVYCSVVFGTLVGVSMLSVMLCVLMVKWLSFVVNVMLSLMSVMIPTTTTTAVYVH